MKRLHTFCFVIFLTLLTVFTVDARPLPTTVSDDKDPLKDDSIKICTPLTSKGNFLTNVLGKLLNLPKMVKISEVGFLFTALSMDAFQVAAGDPKNFQTSVVLPYLLKSKEMQDSLKLRRTARQIKFQVVRDMLKKVPKLTEEDKKGILNFLSQQVGAPVVMLDKSPLPSFLPQPGPCMIPIGVEIVDAKSGQRVGLETSVICLVDIDADGKKLFSVKDAQDNDTLDIVLGHENAHGIMFDMYGRAFSAIQRVSTAGHDAPYITDLGLSYIEGWAEAFEAVYGPANPKLSEKDRKKYNISDFLFGRQDPIRRDRYIWAKYFGKKTGVLKNGLQLMATEGVVAGQFYDILTSKSISGAFEKCVTVMLLLQPQSYMDFIKGFAQMFPDDKRVVYRIMLEGLNYVPMDKKAASLYFDYYQAKLNFVQKKGPKETLEKAKKTFVDFKEDLFKKAMAGGDVFANVGPQLWFSGKVTLKNEESLSLKEKIAKKFGKDPNVWEFNLDLNTVTRKILKAIFVEEADADKIVAEREKRGFFTGDPLKIMDQLIGSAKFGALKTKIGLKPYEPQANSKPEKQTITLWPEDVERFNVAGE